MTQEGALEGLDTYEREVLASRSDLTSEVELTLARDLDDPVRLALAMNTSVSLAAQEVLSQDAEAYVRFLLAGNTSVAPSVVVTLSGDPHHLVRRAATSNDSVRLTDLFHVAGLNLSDRGIAYVTSRARARGLDSEEFDALRWTWTGTLEELLGTAAEFSGGAA